MKEIPLTKGYVALVDDEDYERLMSHKWKWRALITPSTSYATRREPGSRRTIRMHREILGTSPGMDTDHINGNGLDNQRTNLRECTRQQNLQNSRSHLGSTSQFKGVCWSKWARKWTAMISVDYRTRWLGNFSTEVEAANAYKRAAVAIFGEFAVGERGDR